MVGMARQAVMLMLSNSNTSRRSADNSRVTDAREHLLLRRDSPHAKPRNDEFTLGRFLALKKSFFPS